MNQIGNHTGRLFLLLVDKHPYGWNRTAQGIISLANEYSTEVVELACKRALAFDTLSYKVIKNICQNKTYALPLEQHYMEAR